MYIHTYIHACMHACMHAYIHTYIQTDRQTDKQTDRQTDKQTNRQTDKHACMHTYMHTCIHAYNRIWIHKYIHTIYIYIPTLRPRGKGRKLAWQGAWPENTKGTAQLRSVDERVWSWGMLVRWTYKPMYWGDACWRGRGWDHMIIMCCAQKRMREFSLISQLDDQWLGKMQRSTFRIGVGLWKRRTVPQCKTKVENER